jgi:hypothetical protein
MSPRVAICIATHNRRDELIMTCRRSALMMKRPAAAE